MQKRKKSLPRQFLSALLPVRLPPLKHSTSVCVQRFCRKTDQNLNCAQHYWTSSSSSSSKGKICSSRISSTMLLRGLVEIPPWSKHQLRAKGKYAGQMPAQSVSTLKQGVVQDTTCTLWHKDWKVESAHTCSTKELTAMTSKARQRSVRLLPLTQRDLEYAEKVKEKKTQKRVTKRGLILLDAAIMKNTHLGAVQLKQGNLPAVSPHLTSDHKM